MQITNNGDTCVKSRFFLLPWSKPKKAIYFLKKATVVWYWNEHLLILAQFSQGFCTN